MKLNGKIFSAYARQIFGQIDNAKKCVDTIYFGLLIVDSDGSKTIKYYPSVDFLDAGKFKLSKQLRNELTESKAKDYESLYEVKKQ